MIEFYTSDGSLWLVHDGQFARGRNMQAYPRHVGELREEDLWEVAGEAVIAWRNIGDPFKSDSVYEKAWEKEHGLFPDEEFIPADEDD